MAFFYGVVMSGLRNKLNDYENITDLNIHYEFDDGFVLEFSFEKNSFPYMIGLHKLIDIPLLKKFSEKKVSANYVLSKIMNGKLTEDKIKTSKYFYKIKKIKNVMITRKDGTVYFEDTFFKNIIFSISNKLPSFKLIKETVSRLG